MFSLIGLKAKLAGFGALLLIVLGFIVRLKSVIAQRDRAVQTADILKAQAHQRKVVDKIKKENAEAFVSHRANLIKEVKKSDEEFKGLGNLNNPDDY